MIADIEVLRAIAVLFTVAQHIGLLLPWVRWEDGPLGHWLALWGGVDLFFCISGFVIIRSLYRRDALPLAGWRCFLAMALPFWTRRVWRILPTAWLWIALCLLASAFFNRSGLFGPVAANLADGTAAILQYANIHWYFCSTYPATNCNYVTSLLGPYWSLSLEEQFYITLPFAIFFFPKKRFFIFISIATLAQLFLHRPTWDPLWATRTDGLLLGVAIGLWQGRPSHGMVEPSWLRGNWAAVAVPLAGTALIAVIPSPADDIRFATGLLTLVCAALVFLASYDRTHFLPEGWPRRVMIVLGARSYAIYIIHLPIFILTREIWFRMSPPGTAFDGGDTPAFLLTAAVLLMTAVEINYRLLERPLRTHGKQVARRLAGRLTLAEQS